MAVRPRTRAHHGHAVLLDPRLTDPTGGIDGEGGSEVELVDSIVAVHPGGALMKLLVGAPSLEDAEDAVRAVVGELLEHSELLGDWAIEKCAVELHLDLAKESLDAVDGPDAPPADPRERAARHAGHQVEARTAGRISDEEREAKRAKIRALAPQLAGLNLPSFGHLAFARIARGEFEGAAEAVRPVLDLSIEQRNFGISNSAQRVQGALHADGRRGGGAVISLREEIDAFTATPTSVLIR